MQALEPSKIWYDNFLCRRLWVILNQLDLPPTGDALNKIKGWSTAEGGSGTGLLQDKIEGRLQHRISILKKHGTELCSLL